MDLHPWRSTGSSWTKEKEKIKASSKEEKEKEEIGLQLGAFYVVKDVDVASKAKEKIKASRRARKVSPKVRTKERIKAKESLGKISAVSVYNMAIGQEIVQTRCVSTRLIDLFEKDSFLFVKRALPPFAFVMCLRDFKSNWILAKQPSLYTNERSNPNLV